MEIPRKVGWPKIVFFIYPTVSAAIPDIAIPVLLINEVEQLKRGFDGQMYQNAFKALGKYIWSRNRKSANHYSNWLLVTYSVSKSLVNVCP